MSELTFDEAAVATATPSRAHRAVARRGERLAGGAPGAGRQCVGRLWGWLGKCRRRCGWTTLYRGDQRPVPQGLSKRPVRRRRGPLPAAGAVFRIPRRNLQCAGDQLCGVADRAVRRSPRAHRLGLAQSPGLRGHRQHDTLFRQQLSRRLHDLEPAHDLARCGAQALCAGPVRVFRGVAFGLEFQLAQPCAGSVVGHACRPTPSAISASCSKT